MPVTDADEELVATLLQRDVAATIGARYEAVIRRTAANHREFVDDCALYIERVVDDVQQYFHDVYIDTTWPTCPLHPNHPMWFRDGSWRCGDLIAKLGELGSLVNRKSTPRG